MSGTLSREGRYLEDRKVPLSREGCYLEDRKMPLSRERCYLEDRKVPLSRERRYLEDRKVPLSRERCYPEDRKVPLSRERCYPEDRKQEKSESYNKTSTTMAQKTLTTSYLAQLTNANHDGVTQQIDDRFGNFETDNQLFIQASVAVHQARLAEDAAYRRYSGKDFASDDLKREDGLEDNYMSCIRALLNALLCLPETEPIRRKAEQAVQLFKDFNFRVSDGFEAEARKTINMVQQWRAATTYTLAELGIAEWVTKAEQQAQKVLTLVTIRVDNESAKVKGELAAARKATDEAIRKAYDILNALCVLQPSAELSALVSVLFGIEERAKLYYISGGTSGGGGDKPKPTPDDQGGGDVTPVTPEVGGGNNSDDTNGDEN